MNTHGLVDEPFVGDTLENAADEEERDPEPGLDRLPSPARLEVAVANLSGNRLKDTSGLGARDVREEVVDADRGRERADDLTDGPFEYRGARRTLKPQDLPQ